MFPNLDLLRPHLGGPIPCEPFNAAGPWRHCYGLHCLVGDGYRICQAIVEQVISADSIATLMVDLSQQLTGGAVYHQRAQFTQLNLPLSGPSAWSCQSWLTRSNHSSEPTAPVSSDCHWHAGHLLKANGQAMGLDRLAPPGLCTNLWTLMVALQRNPLLLRDSVHFTFLHNLDQPTAGHTLTAGPVATLSNADQQSVPLTASLQRGPGMIPRTFWQDPAGRVLIAHSGLEAWIWESSNQAHPGRPEQMS